MFLDKSLLGCGISRRVHEILFLGDCTESPDIPWVIVRKITNHQGHALRDDLVSLTITVQWSGAAWQQENESGGHERSGQGLRGVQLGKSTLILKLAQISSCKFYMKNTPQVTFFCKSSSSSRMLRVVFVVSCIVKQFFRTLKSTMFFKQFSKDVTVITSFYIWLIM